MPRFFFDVFNGTGNAPDEEGLDLADQSSARYLALDSVRSIVAEEARKGLIDLGGRIEVKDDAGELLLIVGFVEAFRLRMPDGWSRLS